MPVVPANGAASLTARVESLRRLAKGHKADIRRSKEALRSTMATLAALEHECRLRGIHITGEAEATHGQTSEDDNPQSTSSHPQHQGHQAPHLD